MSPGIQSLIFVPGLIGCTLGTIWGGALTDRYTRWKTRKNDGIFEPEPRLVSLILPLIVVPGGMLMSVSLRRLIVDRD